MRLRAKAFQIRAIAVWLMSHCLARQRVDHCVASRGVDSSVVGQDAFHVGIGDFPRYAGARFVERPIQATREESAPPFAYPLFRDVHVPSDRGGRFNSRASQHASRSQSQRLCRRRPARPALERLSFICRQYDWGTGRPVRIRRVPLVAEYDDRPKLVSRVSNSPL